MTGISMVVVVLLFFDLKIVVVEHANCFIISECYFVSHIQTTINLINMVDSDYSAFSFKPKTSLNY